VLRALQQAPAMRTTTIPPPGSPRKPEGAAAKEPFSAKSSGVRRAPLRDVERELILSAFEAAKGNLSRAAADLGIPRTTLRDKLRRYGVLVRAAD
jgi:DNA-binding NtrC family response regulator